MTGGELADAAFAVLFDALPDGIGGDVYPPSQLPHKRSPRQLALHCRTKLLELLLPWKRLQSTLQRGYIGGYWC